MEIEHTLPVRDADLSQDGLRLRGDAHHALIAEWQVQWELSPAEVARLHSVLSGYPADEVRAELGEELRWILGVRKLATVAPLTAEDIRQARHAVESGLTPVRDPGHALNHRHFLNGYLL